MNIPSRNWTGLVLIISSFIYGEKLFIERKRKKKRQKCKLTQQVIQQGQDLN